MIPSSGESIFGRVVSAHQVSQALISTIKQWQPYYLNHIARAHGEPFERFAGLRGFRVATEMEAMPEDQKPLLILVNQGLRDEPIRSSAANRIGKHYTAIWEYDLGIQVVAKGTKVNAEPRAIALASMYSAAVRLLLLQQRDPGELISMTDWVDEQPGGLDSSADRTTCMVIATYLVTVPMSASSGTGPDLDWLPDEPPPLAQDPEWPLVTDPSATVEKVPPDESP